MKELAKIWSALIRVGLVFAVGTLFALSVSIQWFYLFWFIPIPIPSPQGQTIPTLFIENVHNWLIPSGATLVVGSPLDAFTLSVSIAATFGGILALVMMLIEFWRFARPGLYPKERRGLAILIVSATFLMLAGGVFSYQVVTPLMFKALYAFIPPGVAPLFDVTVIAEQVAGMMFLTSVAFLLPIFMALLSFARVVPPSFWAKYARHAIFATMLGSAIIIPDPTGISMIILSIPLCLLYGVGYIVSMWIAGKPAIRT